jgi:hypothetical protein
MIGENAAAAFSTGYLQALRLWGNPVDNFVIILL